MRQPFVNATLNDRRKGRETLCQTGQSHPLRPTSIPSSDAPVHAFNFPVKIVAKPKKEEPLSDLDAMKMELLKAMRAVEKKPKVVSKSKLIGLGMVSAEDPAKDYNDILAMLLAKK